LISQLAHYQSRRGTLFIDAQVTARWIAAAAQATPTGSGAETIVVPLLLGLTSRRIGPTQLSVSRV